MDKNIGKNAKVIKGKIRKGEVGKIIDIQHIPILDFENENKQFYLISFKKIKIKL